MMVEFMKPALSRWPVSLRLAAARLRRDRRGSIAVEFAMIVPLMLAMFFGIVEFSSGFAVKRKVSMAAEELADMVSRNKTVNDAAMTNFFNIGRAVMTPFSSGLLMATVTEIYIDPATGVAKSQWSQGSAPKPANTIVAVPPNLIARDPVTNAILPDQYLIFAETSYNYQASVPYFTPTAGIPLTDQIYMRPRLSTCVFYPSTPNPANCPTS